ncbi:MAG: hypothetical protein AAGH89_11145 [Verrucomicrobiota bacterium]
MNSWISNALDLRNMPSGLAASAVAERVADTGSNESFWLLHDHEPVEICKYLFDQGFTIQTYLFSLDEYLIFVANLE